MKQHLAQRLLLAAFLLVTTALQAQIPNGYYNNANGKTGDELKTALHEIIKGHTKIAYRQLWNAFWSTDNKGNGVVWDMYSDIPGGTPPYSYQLGEDQCGTYSGEGSCYNREHSWPQSWFSSEERPSCDLHHIFPTDGYVNNQRENHPYGEVQHATWTSQNGSKLGTCKSSLGYSGTVFEPINAYKGDLARALMYMSVRYYGEDSNWGSSGMTSKSEILPWAIAMLMDWSDADPVSQKEIDRNNAIYNDYQHNRNPFIDHPEYARMIWDPNWHEGEYYAITCATGLSHGSVSAPENALEGTTVYVTATPNPGYMVDTYTVYKTDSPNTTVAVSSNGTFTMPNYAVTVSASFVVNNTYYDITLGTVSHGSISASASSAKSGTNITLTATPSSGYSLFSWYVFKTGDMNTTVHTGTTGSFVMPAFDVTVMATFVQGSGGNGDYVKVTSAPTDWSGEYLIVNESYNKAFNGSLSTLDANNNTISVNITSNTIPANETTNAAAFTIAPMTGGYSIKGTSGKYIGYSGNSNGLNASNTALANTISLSNGVVVIKGTGSSTLQYNNSAYRFRYYSSSQQPIQLYRKSAAAATTPTHTIHFNGNGASGLMPDQTVNEFEATALNANTFTREGFEFDGWNTEANGTGTYYADEASITLTDDITLYAMWDPKYNITLAETQHGSISASVNSAVEDAIVTLTATPESGYALRQWTVVDALNNPITVTENQFEMPARNVTVTASFRYMGEPQVSYQLVTSTDQLVAGEKYLIVNRTNSKALSTTQNTNNRSAVDVTIANDVINSISETVCELELGGESGAWTLFDAGWNNGTGGYLYAASKDNNHLKTRASNTDDNSRWAISVTTAGVANITAQGTNTHNIIKYNPNTNNNNPIFSCYASGQQEVSLFHRVLTYPAVEQTVTLSKGWNWWSTNLDISLAELETALGNHGVMIKSQTEYATHGGTAWDNSDMTSDIDVRQLYKIRVNANCQITLSGMPVNPADYPITLYKGYNWIGFPCSQSIPLTEAFGSNFTPTTGDMIKSQNGYAIYNGTSWETDDLEAFEPGQGYIYKSNATGTKTFTFPAGQ